MAPGAQTRRRNGGCALGGSDLEIRPLNAQDRIQSASHASMSLLGIELAQERPATIGITARQAELVQSRCIFTQRYGRWALAQLAHYSDKWTTP